MLIRIRIRIHYSQEIVMSLPCDLRIPASSLGAILGRTLYTWGPTDQWIVSRVFCARDPEIQTPDGQTPTGTVLRSIETKLPASSSVTKTIMTKSTKARLPASASG